MKLHDYQLEAVQRAFKDTTYRWIFNDECGLGKSAQAIEMLKRCKFQSAVIVCPAVVRLNWASELKKWWPDCTKSIGIINSSLGIKNLSKSKRQKLEEAYASNIRIISYNLFNIMACDIIDFLIFDECHRLAHPTAAWSKHAKMVCMTNKNLRVLGLTATLMPNKPQDAIGICETIWPNRFGGLAKNGQINFKALQRYCNSSHNGHGWSYEGSNPLFMDELKNRLAKSSSRTTKQQVAHLLQPFEVKYQLVEKPDIWTETGDINTDLQTAAQFKEEYTIDTLKDMLASTSHVAIMTYLRETAFKYTELLREQNLTVYCITGELSPEKRNEQLAAASLQKQAVIICTMHSVGIGIDLTFCSQAIFVELYSKPETVVQALGRFSRLSGKVPSFCTLLAVSGTIDELVATKLLDKIAAINTLIKAGATEEKLNDSLGTQQDFEKLLKDAVNNVEEDEYSCYNTTDYSLETEDY
jgi:SWI/SNF-related matrix-associated actin-dependent regulator 1 of chromatin subfamily A